MGKFAQPLLVIAGTIIGAYFGNPELGALIGGIAGQLLFPTKLPTQFGPRLQDTAQTVSTVGAPIPRGWGTFPASGCIMVQTDLVETIDTQTVGGKGGPKQTTETPQYHQTFAIGINDGLIQGIRVIWANGKPIYDRRPQRISISSPGDSESDTLYQARQAASDQLEAQFTLYLGTEAQLPDPTLEAFYGVGNISAFRGLAYIVFHNWLNKVEDGNRMPSQWKFEVFGEGNASTTSPTQYEVGEYIAWQSGDQPVALGSGMVAVFQPVVQASGEFEFTSYYANFAQAQARLDELLQITDWSGSANIDYQPHAPACNVLQGCIGFAIGYTSGSASLSSNGGDDMTSVTNVDHNFAYVAYNCFEGQGPAATDFSSFGAIIAAFSIGIPRKYDNGAGFNGVGIRVASGDVTSYVDIGWFGGDQDLGDGTHLLTSKNHFLRVARAWQSPPDPCLNRPDVPGASNYCVSALGQITARGPWTHITGSSVFHILQAPLQEQGSGGTHDISVRGVGPIVIDTDPNYNDAAYWTAAYDSAVVRRDLPLGLVYGADYPVLFDTAYSRPAVATAAIDTDTVGLDVIVNDLCIEANLTTINVTDLAATQVMGYVRTGVFAARAAIEPLAQAYNFDGVESNGLLVFRIRGKNIVADIELDELGAVVIDDSGSSSGGQNSASKMKVTETQDVDLPVRVRVHYLSQSRDYELGEQDSPYRVDTDAVQISDVQMPIVLSDDDAMKIAQSLWAQAWRERTSYATVLDAGFQELEPADAMAIPVDGITVRTRIVQITDTLPAVRQFTLVRDDQAAYKSYAVSNPSVPIPRPVLSITLPADAVFLDLPLLRDTDNDGGFYAATYGLVWGEFRGAGIYRSTDGGGSFDRVGVAGPPSCTLGIVHSPLGVGEFTSFDEENFLVVELQGGALFSATEDAVIAGANACAVGVNGRWEIIQFKNAAIVATNSYRLSGLLRGRRGTEWAIGTGQNDDQFILIEGVVRIPLDSTLIGNPYLYKTVATGSLIDGTGSVSFTGEGTALKPFAPVALEGTRDVPATNDWTLKWIRRGRIGETLQSGTDIALSEATESYSIDIYNGGSIVRTATTNLQKYIYLAADQVTDFGSHQSSVHFIVYQISAVVGRGYGAEATV